MLIERSVSPESDLICLRVTLTRTASARVEVMNAKADEQPNELFFHFKHVTPKRRKDQFGRDTTKPSDYLLSLAVYPTGVRTPLLSDVLRKDNFRSAVYIQGKSPTSIPRNNIQDTESEDNVRSHSGLRSDLKQTSNNSISTATKISKDVSSPSANVLQRTISKDYQWPLPQTRFPESKRRSKTDIRDHLYRNTYGAERLSFKSTDRLQIPIKAACWSPSEGDLTTGSTSSSSLKITSKKWLNRALASVTGDCQVTKSSSGSPASARGFKERGREPQQTKNENQSLFEVWSCIPPRSTAIWNDDDWETSRKSGCLYSDVQQCIDFVSSRQRMTRKVDRPLKGEKGRYRPFSAIEDRIPKALQATSRLPQPKSVDIYKEHADSIVLRMRRESMTVQPPSTPAVEPPRCATAASFYSERASRTPPSSAIEDSSRLVKTRTRWKTVQSHFEDLNHKSSLKPLIALSGKAVSLESNQLNTSPFLDIISLSPKLGRKLTATPSVKARTTSDVRRKDVQHLGDADQQRIADNRPSEIGAGSKVIFLPMMTTSECSLVHDSDEAVTDDELCFSFGRESSLSNETELGNRLAW